MTKDLECVHKINTTADELLNIYYIGNEEKVNFSVGSEVSIGMTVLLHDVGRWVIPAAVNCMLIWCCNNNEEHILGKCVTLAQLCLYLQLSESAECNVYFSRLDAIAVD